MPHQIAWYIPNRIFLVHISGDVSRDDLAAFNMDVYRYLESSPTPPVHSIVDDSQLGKVGIGFTEVQTLLSAVFHPHVGHMLVVGPGNPIFNFLGSLITRLGGVQYRRFPTLEEAVNYLHQVDATLPYDEVA